MPIVHPKLRPVETPVRALPSCVAVTGGAGFLGNHLCDRLSASGHEVLVVDNLSTGSMSHLTNARRGSRFEFIKTDLVEALPAAVSRAGWIFHLASPASPAYYQRKPVQTTLTNTVGTWRVLDCASLSGARVLQASTSEVYGTPQVHPQPESYWGRVNSFGPRACYDEGKRSAEALCYGYANERGVAVRIARLFNCYGPRLLPGDGRVVSNFIVQALRGLPLTVYGDGLQMRSFCFVDDTVQGLLQLMASSVATPVNIGNPHEHIMLQLAEMVLRLTASRSVLLHLPLPADDPDRRCPDVGRAFETIGWLPRVALEEGLRETIAYFRYVLSRELVVGRRSIHS